MSDFLIYSLFLILFFVLELIYFKIAVQNKIIDKPNERSSHQHFTVRGGGIIFPVAVICWSILNGFQYPLFLIALLAISTISFVDDILDIHSRTRFIVQLLSVATILWYLPIGIAWYSYIIVTILILGAINAYNFMDGINGMTGIYSIVTLCSLLWINQYVQFIPDNFIIFPLLALLVFGFFNFRKKAKCFAGDVGSVAMAFIVSFLLLLLISKTENLLYILLLAIYGFDAVSTIIFRLIRKENIFEAHRTHFYQYLTNQRGWTHLVTSSLYGTAQLLFNIILFVVTPKLSIAHSLFLTLLIVFSLGSIVLLIRIKIEGKERLLKSGK